MRAGTLSILFVRFLAASHTLQDLISLTWDRTQALGVRAQSPNPWTSREFPTLSILFTYYISSVWHMVGTQEIFVFCLLFKKYSLN